MKFCCMILRIDMYISMTLLTKSVVIPIVSCLLIVSEHIFQLRKYRKRARKERKEYFKKSKTCRKYIAQNNIHTQCDPTPVHFDNT